MFKIYDDNRDRKLDYKELQTGINDYGMSLTREELKELFQRFDKDGSGTIDFDELLENIRV